ncbi:MAG: glycosyltransferase [Clostridiales bacterium]|nr:glycosyltransferase [Clostridiales bacterium]
MTLITPSQWLADLVKESFLKEYPVEVKHNDIDRNTFKPTESDFRSRYGLEGKIVLLGVALPWDIRKGLKDIIKLASMLNGEYAIVLVGLDEEKIKDMSVRFSNADSKMNGNVLVLSKKGDNESAASVEYTASDSIAIPSGVENLYRAITGDETNSSDDSQLGVGKIIAMPRTNSPKELAEIYTAADIFIDPTYEDNYPTVNLEALACGTKVITYDTGGCAETLEFGK